MIHEFKTGNLCAVPGVSCGNDTQRLAPEKISPFSGRFGKREKSIRRYGNFHHKKRHALCVAEVGRKQH
jgi:hypothetical protein